MSPRVSEDYKRQKKLSLLQAAKRVFIAKGYTQATMQDIIDEAGVSRGALYAYFDNIEHVYVELLQHEDQQDVHYFRTDGTEAFWQQISEWVSKQRKEIDQIDQTLVRANSEFFSSTNYRSHKASYPYITARYKRIVKALADFFQTGTSKGEFVTCLPAESIARYVVSFVDGLMMNTAHLGTEQTKVNGQMDVLLFTLEQLLRPAISNDKESGFK